eukprot:11769438-Alexandrium_andersonii.AAC.1
MHVKRRPRCVCVCACARAHVRVFARALARARVCGCVGACVRVCLGCSALGVVRPRWTVLHADGCVILAFK